MKYLSVLTIFLGSFLLFLLEPLVGRTLLPSFGGSSSVWVTCIVAFQVLLLGGYGYAFIPSNMRLTVRRLHLGLLFAAILVMAGCVYARENILSFTVGLPPALGVLTSVLMLSGFAFVVLSANSTTVQSWSSQVIEGREVYRLYAVSNAGSLAGLLFYPILLEPFFSINFQWTFLCCGMVVYAVLLAVVAGRNGVTPRSESHDSPSSTQATEGGLTTSPHKEHAVLWFVLPLLSTALLTATTTHLTTDVMPIPLLWCVLLAVYLVSYIVGFSSWGERLISVWTCLVPFILLFAAWSWFPRLNPIGRFVFDGTSALLLLGFVCTAIHGWLCRIRPEAHALARYYFLNACGGAFGGLATGCIAPLVFNGIHEYPLTLLACTFVFAFLVWKFVPTWPVNVQRMILGLLALVPLLLFQGWRQHGRANGDEMWRQRGFYGVVTVTEKKNSDVPQFGKSDLRLMRNGQTTHGAQFMAPALKNRSTMYYTDLGGGIAFTAFGLRDTPRPLHVGAIGLGAGVMATWGQAGDVIRFYEISSACIDAATNKTLFTFCSESKAKIEYSLSDARLALQNEQKDLVGTNAFDILVVDAYTGDSVPLHLITAEAFELYSSVLKEDGVLALHLSNWHVNLWPVIKAAAKHLGWQVYGTYSRGGGNPLAAETAWAFLTKKPRTVKLPFGVREVDWSKVKDQPPLRDGKGSLLLNLSISVTPPL